MAEELPAREPDVELEGAVLRAEVEGVVRDAVGEVDAEEGAKVSSVRCGGGLNQGLGVGSEEGGSCGVWHRIPHDRLRLT